MHISIKRILFGLVGLGILSNQVPCSFGQTINTAVPEIPTIDLSSPNEKQAKQGMEFYQQAKAAGLSDLDIEHAALQKGYTLDQINAIKKRLEITQTGAKTEAISVNRSSLNEARNNSTPSRLDTSLSTSAPSNPLIFGSSFFNNTTTTFEPNLRIATPKNYILGPDDELVVDIYGNSVDNFRLKVSPEGTVKMLNLAPLNVNGLTIEQASDRIISRLRQAYVSLNQPGSGTRTSITLGNVRSIKVIITGEAVKPGTFTVSSLATAFNVLYLAGGPNSSGSFRYIDVIRNNMVFRKIDLYDFLISGSLKDNISLQDQDIILIHPFEKRVEMFGAVKRPGLFEANASDTFLDLIKYSGGFTSKAYLSSIKYKRVTGKDYKIGTIEPDQQATFIPQNGDFFEIGQVINRIQNRVTVEGAVYREGEYALDQGGMTVKELIKKAEGLQEDAFLNRAFIQRQDTNLRPILIAFDLGKLMQGEIEDIPLMREDVLQIKKIEELKENFSVSAYGAVIKPGTFDFREGMTISDLILKAGGYTEGGIPYRIEVSRRVKWDTTGIPTSQNVRIFTINVSDSLKINPQDLQFKLAPFDLVFIRKSHRYESQKMISVLGEVVYPGKYTILNNFERISDLLKKAGGLKPEAYVTGARFYRGNELIAIDLESIFNKPSLASNLLLLDGDTLIIPRKQETVKIQGGVLSPSMTNFDASLSFNDYISQAGGYTERAWKKRIFVSYPNGRTSRTKTFIFIRSYPKVNPGSVISVPVKDQKQNRELSPGERMAIFSTAASVVTTLTLAIINLIK